MSRLMTARQVATRLNVPQRWVEEASRRGDGPPMLRLGRNVRWDERDLEAWLDAQRDAARRNPNEDPDGR